MFDRSIRSEGTGEPAPTHRVTERPIRLEDHKLGVFPQRYENSHNESGIHRADRKLRRFHAPRSGRRAVIAIGGRPSARIPAEAARCQWGCRHRVRVFRPRRQRKTLGVRARTRAEPDWSAFGPIGGRPVGRKFAEGSCESFRTSGGKPPSWLSSLGARAFILALPLSTDERGRS